MNLSNNSLTRLLNYLDGDFYSVEKNNRIFNVTGIYFVVSDDGRYSVISYCNEISINCDLNLEEYKAIYRCKKMSKQNCSTLLMEKEITLGDKKDISKEDVNKYFLLNDNSPLSKDFFSDMQIQTYKEKLNKEDEFLYVFEEYGKLSKNIIIKEQIDFFVFKTTRVN